MQAVIQWQQYECHCEIAYEVANNYLKIIEPYFANCAGNGDEGHAGKRSAYHPEGNHPPFAATIADKEGFIVRMSGSIESNSKQQREIRNYNNQQQSGIHGRKIKRLYVFRAETLSAR
jgi:hypothetical protein